MSSNHFMSGVSLVLAALVSTGAVACSSDDGSDPKGPLASGGALATGGATGGGPVNTGGSSAGGFSANGGAPALSGGTTATGGAPAPSGGTTATDGSGGLPGSGGETTGSGGALPGSGGTTPGSGGTTPGSGGATATGGATSHTDLGKGDGHDVIAIGDSWMSLGFVGIQQSLLKASGQPYRVYGVAGTQLLNGQIPGQYTSAKLANPDIKTVVMTGGGNDILLTGLQTDCANGTDRCTQQLAKIAQGLADLWAQMSKDGVQDVVHVMYSADAGQGVENDPAVGLKKVCDAVPPPLRCHLLATDSFVQGQFQLDGIHPSNAAYDRIGKGVFDLMTSERMRR